MRQRELTGRFESRTEDIVREHFSQFADEITLEQQSSLNPIVDKLLQTASKSGHGKGYPDFIIQYNKDANFIIIVETKANTLFHESQDQKHFKDYAVDGVLLYSSYLSREFDVLAIAVSGTSKEELKVTHYLQLKGETRPVKEFSDVLLPVSDYYEAYRKNEIKTRQDYAKLLEYASSLNTTLHELKVNSSERSILLSCILLALRIDKFRNYYQTEDNPQILTNNLVGDVIDELTRQGVSKNKLDIIEAEYNKIKVKSTFAKEKNVLRSLVFEIDKNVNDFMQTHKYYDTLGELYIQFLRYANIDKGLGIVLTPLHITEFFTDIAEVSKDSVVFDNCTGTCSFLIAAMRRMVEEAKSDSKLIDEIKNNRLIGIEKDEKMVSLAVTNMAIHNDGKSNIMYGSGIDSTFLSKIKNCEFVKLQPTVGLLNPPYKSNKKTDIDELEFVYKNLDVLVQGGTCVAIVPMGSAIPSRGKTAEWKERLLKEHTLEAVFSMPDELFYNSDVGVVTCIMVFTAHRPHPKDKQTFFGYFKDDGFTKKKGGGRVDFNNKWTEIKRKWLYLYRNKKEELGLSVMKTVGANDPWAAEIYMETDYSVLCETQFRDAIRNFINYKLSYDINYRDIIFKPFHSNLPMLNIESWEWFPFYSEDGNKNALFSQIVGAKSTPLEDLETEHGSGDYPYVTTQSSTNGVKGFYNFWTDEGGCFTVDSAVAGFCSYREQRFSASDHVEKLIPNFDCDIYVAMFLVAIINLEQYRYNYGIKCNQGRLRSTKIKLPSTESGTPDWEYMRRYIKGLPYSQAL